MEFRRVLFRSTEYIDITVAIHPGMTVWPGAPSPRFEQRLDMEHEADVNDSDVFFNLHSGTHVDAPSHFVRGGRTADDLSLNTLIGKAYVVEVPPQVDCIDSRVLEALGIPGATKRLLLRTRNSALWTTKPGDFRSEERRVGKEWVSP